jgi:hypothetical protein
MATETATCSDAHVHCSSNGWASEEGDGLISRSPQSLRAVGGKILDAPCSPYQAPHTTCALQLVRPFYHHGSMVALLPLVE